MKNEGTAKDIAKKGFNTAKKAIKAVSKIKNVATWKIWLIIASALLAIFFCIAIVGAISVLISDELEKQQSQVDNSGNCNVSGGKVDSGGLSSFEKNAKGGELEGKSKKMVEIAKKNKVPPKLFMAIVASESEWGKGPNATIQKNPLSIMGSGPLQNFSTIEKGLDAGAKNLYDLYIKEGLTTPEKIGPKYAPEGASNDPTNLNANWIPTVKSIMSSLGKNDKDEGTVSCDSDVPAGESIKKLDKVIKENGGKLPKTKHKQFEPNTYAHLECTWYVYNRRKELGLPVELTFGNGGDWPERAKAQGYKTGKKAKVGAMVSWPYNSKDFGSTACGHIAFVEAVHKDGTITVSEHNIKPYQYGERTFKPASDLTFIY